LDVLPGEFDGDALVLRSGVEAAAFGASGIVDRLAAEDLGEAFEGDVVARVDEFVPLRRTGDVAAVEGSDGQSGKRASYQRAQPRLADVFVENPQEVAD